MEYISFKSNIHTLSKEVDSIVQTVCYIESIQYIEYIITVHRIHTVRVYLMLHAHDALAVDAQVRLLGHAQRLCAYSTSLP